MKRLWPILLAVFALGTTVTISGDWFDSGEVGIDETWVLPANADVSDNVYATAVWSPGDGDDGGSLQAFLHTSSDLNAGIALSAVIDSVFIGVEAHNSVASNGGYIFGASLDIRNTQNQSSSFGSSDGTKEIGGASSGWDVLPSVSEVNAAPVEVNFHWISGSGTLSVDWIYMRVVYHSNTTQKKQVIGARPEMISKTISFAK